MTTLMFVHIMSKKPDWTITLLLPTLRAINLIELSLLWLSTLMFVHIMSKKSDWMITLMFVYIKKRESILVHWIITLMITLCLPTLWAGNLIDHDHFDVCPYYEQNTWLDNQFNVCQHHEQEIWLNYLFYVSPL